MQKYLSAGAIETAGLLINGHYLLAGCPKWGPQWCGYLKLLLKTRNLIGTGNNNSACTIRDIEYSLNNVGVKGIIGKFEAMYKLNPYSASLRPLALIMNYEN